MTDFVFEIDEEASASASTGGGSKFGTLETGMYDVTITTASLGKTKGGNNKIDLSIVTADGHETTIYQAFVPDKKWSTGSENFGYKTWQAFITASGMTGLTTFQKPLLKEDGSPVMKNGAPIVLNAIKELEGKQVTLAIVKKLDFHNGEEKAENEIFASFSFPAHASSKEILGKTEAGLTYNKMKDVLADRMTKEYKAYKADAPEAGTAPEAEDEDLGL